MPHAKHAHAHALATVTAFLHTVAIVVAGYPVYQISSGTAAKKTGMPIAYLISPTGSRASRESLPRRKSKKKSWPFVWEVAEVSNE